MFIKLNQSWLGHQPGEVVTVAALRGAVWVEHGIGVEVDEKGKPVVKQVKPEPKPEPVIETATAEPQAETAMKPKAYKRKR